MTLNNALDKENLYRQTRTKHWDAIAGNKITSQSWGRFYHEKLHLIYQFLIPSGLDVLEIGCGKGDLIASLKPAQGLGVDFSEEMVKQASAQHPEIQFKIADAHSLNLGKSFDIIILSDLVNDL